MLTITHPVDLREIQKPLTEFVGYGGVKVKTVKASFGKVPVEEVTSGRARAIEVVATSDGRGYIPEWHKSDGILTEGDTVYVEVYSAAGREFHGYLDSVTRKIVQTG